MSHSALPPEQKTRKALTDAAGLVLAAVRAYLGDWTGVAAEGVKHLKVLLIVAGSVIAVLILMVSMLIFLVAGIVGGVGGGMNHAAGEELTGTLFAAGSGASVSQGYHGTGRGAGVDFAATQGTPIYAVFDGTVDYYLWMDDDGAIVSLGAVAFLRSGSTTAIYSHLSSFDTDGSAAIIASYPSLQQYAHSTEVYQYSREVSAGDLIGGVGNTGNSFGNHLHFGLMVDGSPVNPFSILTEYQ